MFKWTGVPAPFRRLGRGVGDGQDAAPLQVELLKPLDLLRPQHIVEARADLGLKLFALRSHLLPHLVALLLSLGRVGLPLLPLLTLLLS